MVKENLEEIFSSHSFDFIIHNAGLTKTPNKQDYFDVNCTFLENIIQAIQQVNANPSKFTFISSLAAFGPAEYTKEGVVTEESVPHPVTNYGRSKLAAEKYLKSTRGINYTIIRPTVVYGPREKDLFTVYDLINKGLEMTVGLKDQQLTFIYVKDLVRVILDATLADKKNVAYFVSDLDVVSSSSYNKAIRKALGKKRSLKLRLPIFLVKTLGFITENIGKITNSYPALNLEKVNELKAKSWKCDTSNLVQDLGFVPEYDLERGLKETMEWYKTNNWLN